MEGSGGLSVSDLIEQHSRTNIPRPVPPGSPDASTTGRRALPETPPDTGRRSLPEPPADQRQPAPQNFAGGQAPDQTGRRRRPEPEQNGAPARPAPGERRAEQTGTRPRPAQNPPQNSPQNPPQGAVHPGEHTGTRPRPAQNPPQNGAHPGEQTGMRPRPDANGAPRRPAPGDAVQRPDANGAPRRPAPGDAVQRPVRPGEASGAVRRPGSPADAPGVRPGDASGPIRRPDTPGDPNGGPRGARPGDVTGAQRRPDATGTQRRPAPGAPVDPAVRPGEATGAQRRPDAPGARPGEASGTMRRPVPPGAPVDADGVQRRLDAPPGAPRRLAPGDAPSSNGIPRPPVPDGGPRRPTPGEALDAGPRRPAPGEAPDGLRRHDVPSSNGIPRPPVPGEALDGGPRRPGPGDAPDGGPRRPTPGEALDGGPRRPVPGEAPDGLRRHDVPSSNGIPRPPVPGDARRMPPGEAANGRPDAGPRRPHPGDAPSSSSIRRPDPNGVPPEAGPRRLLAGEAPSANRIPRPPVPGEGPETARRPGNGDVTGRSPMPSRAESSGPRPAPGVADRLGGAPGVSDRLTGAPEDAPADDPGPEATQIAPAAGVAKVERREDIDPMSLTTEMEAIGDEVKKRREVDHTLARFSAVHDELLEQERQRKERRAKLMPWLNDDEENEEATQFADPVQLGEDDEQERPAGRTPQQRKMMRAAKVGAIAAAAVVFVSTGVGWGAMQWADGQFRDIDALGGNSQAVQQAEKQLGDENFLLVGSDTRAGAKAGDNVGTADTEKGARSDVIMLAHIPADRKRMVVVSLPRDVRVDRPNCRSWDSDSGQYGGALAPAKDVMANSVYAEGGPECVANMMTQLTGLKINHFVSIDFVGFREMATAVGGVEICTSKPIKDNEIGVVIDKPGKHILKGDQALQYVRARYVQGDDASDFARIQRQQQFLSSMLRTALSSEVLLNPSRLNDFIKAFTRATVGDNIGVAQLLDLGQSLQGLDAGRVSFVTMPHWTDDNKLINNPDDNIERLDNDGVKRLFQSIIDGTPLPLEKPVEQKPGEQNAPPKAGSVIDPKSFLIQVVNGDPANDGAAGRIASSLQNVGFQVSRKGDAVERATKTTIRYSKGSEDRAATLRAAVPGAELVEAPEMGGAVLLTIGAGFDEKVVDPKSGGTAPAPNQNQGSGNKNDLSIVNAGQDPCAK
ncbi:LCP family protein [Nocardia sp. NRRL S-836]|uniref:LCP family protein n=1 Tax=Nocardia sp. NRRL S-836 TaxID=1519492 RepID=UPI0012F937F9|nr:LCP family protein [Nocardia sp. NRRL S-836]